MKPAVCKCNGKCDGGCLRFAPRPREFILVRTARLLPATPIGVIRPAFRRDLNA